MKQKFGKLKFVRVCKEMPSYMTHYDSDFNAIVAYTYSQQYGGNDIDNYSLYKIENGKIINEFSWYEESQLSLCENQDMDKSEQMIEDFNFNNH